LCDGRVDPAHVEGVHLVVQSRGRRRALQDLGWLRRRAAVDVSWVELVLVEEARWSRLVAHLLALRGAPFTRGVILLAVRHVAKRDLLGRLRHAEEELLGARRLGCVAVALHQAHEEIPVPVHCRSVLLLSARVPLVGQVVPLGEEILQRLLRPRNLGRRYGEAHWSRRDHVVHRVLRVAHT
jgi:hypothetical protein